MMALKKHLLQNKKTLTYLTHLGALTPLALMIWHFYTNQLTINPIQEITLRTGRYALILLILSLAVTPLNSLFKWRQLIPLRKPLGLYAFFYAALHFLIFIGLDYGFNWTYIQEAIFEKRFALVGFTAFLLLLPLAITSTKGWMKRLGKNWKRLHRLVYPAALLVIVHFIWLVKADIQRPIIYGAVLVILLLLRWKTVRKWLTGLRAGSKIGRRSKPQKSPSMEVGQGH